MVNNITAFNIRVYQLIMNKRNQVLISDEMFLKQKLIKYPGGGLEFGEGVMDCFQREAMEELGQSLLNTELFHVTEPFIPTKFFAHKQLIAIYYTAELSAPEALKVSTVPFDFVGDEDGTQSFRWVDLIDLPNENFTFETDVLVAQKLKDKYLNHG